MSASRLAGHLRAHWYHHLAGWGAAAAVAAVLTAGTAGITHHFEGGYRRSPPPPQIRISGGAVPARVSLARFIARVHNQGTSSSCVAQTLSTMEEITQAERGRRLWFSAGYIYDQINGGRDAGSSYDDAFGVLINQGDDRLAVFPHDGQDWWFEPSYAQRTLARPFRFSSYHSIAAYDRHTMEAELASGRPFALAIHVRDTFYHHFGDAAPIASNTGAYYFDHSLTAIGYSPAGLQVLNSWGPSWGSDGIATLTWPLVRAEAFAIDIAAPGSSFKPAPRHHQHAGRPNCRNYVHNRIRRKLCAFSAHNPNAPPKAGRPGASPPARNSTGPSPARNPAASSPVIV